jgi:hypothetical protein
MQPGPSSIEFFSHQSIDFCFVITRMSVIVLYMACIVLFYGVVTTGFQRAHPWYIYLELAIAVLIDRD